MSLLVRTPAPFSTESLLAFVLRVSEVNGYDTPAPVYSLAEIPRGKELTKRFPVAQLARLLGRDVSELARIAYELEEDGVSSFKILDHPLGEDESDSRLRLRRPALCPDCVDESAYIDAFWDLDVAVACSRHRRKAVRRCASCKGAIRWARPGLTTCHCRASFIDSVREEVNEATCELMGFVQARLHNTYVSTLPNTAGFPLKELGRLPFGSLVDVLDLMGIHSLWSWGKQPGEDEPAAAAAVEVLEQWPAGYHQFLARFGHRVLAERPSTVGLRRQFEPFYGTMFKNRRFAPAMDFFQQEFVQFGLHHWGRALVDKKMRRTQKPTEDRFVSKSEFARRFGIWKPTMQRMIADGSAVTKIINTGKRSITVVDLQRSELPVESAGVVSVRDVADYCGLPVSVLCELREIGVFATKQRLGRESSWHKDDVEEFLRRGLSLAEDGRSISTAVRLRDVMRLKLRDAAAKAEVVAALFDGRLPVAGRVGNKLGGLQVDRKQLNQFILQQRVKVEGNSYSFPEAAMQTGLDTCAIPSAVELELLATIERRGRVRIAVDSVERFNAEHVPLSTLAKQLSTSARALARACLEQGIEVTTLARANHAACQLIVSRDLGAKLVAYWKARPAKRAGRVRDKTLNHEQLLQDYLDRIAVTGVRLPRRRSGKLNRVAIARACGFHRNVLHSVASVINLLEAFSEKERRRFGDDRLSPAEALQRYLDNLRDSGSLLPRAKRGKPNRLAIAGACNFSRDVFYDSPEVADLLDAYAAAER